MWTTIFRVMYLICLYTATYYNIKHDTFQALWFLGSAILCRTFVVEEARK